MHWGRGVSERRTGGRREVWEGKREAQLSQSHGFEVGAIVGLLTFCALSVHESDNMRNSATVVCTHAHVILTQ